MSIKDIEKLFSVVKVKNDICARPHLRKKFAYILKTYPRDFRAFEG